MEWTTIHLDQIVLVVIHVCGHVDRANDLSSDGCKVRVDQIAVGLSLIL